MSSRLYKVLDYVKKPQMQFILVVLLFSILSIYIIKPWGFAGVFGESDTNILGTISLTERGSIFVTESDFLIAEKEFPKHFAGRDYSKLSLTQLGDEKILHYFPTYSIVVLPLKYVFKFFGLPLHTAFQFTNMLLYLVALFVVFKFLKATHFTKMAIIISLSLSPTILYMWWLSSEVCIFSFIVLSLTFFYNKNYKLSAFFISIAGTMNIAIMAFGFFIIIQYFIEVYQENKKLKFYDIIKENSFRTLALALSFFPTFIPLIVNYFTIGSFFSKLTESRTSENIFGRFYAYLFDLNYGYFAYFPIFIVLALIIFIFAIYKRKVDIILKFLAFLAVIVAYSITYHIDCGMQGIHRYNAFALPFLIFFVVVNYHIVINRLNFKVLFILSIIPLAFMSYSNKRVLHIYLNNVSKAFFNHVPFMYNPLVSTFISRVEHYDYRNYYDNHAYNKPVIYFDKALKARKILVNKATVDRVFEMLTGDKQSILFLQSEVNRIKESKTNSLQYINISSFSGINLYKTPYNIILKDIRVSNGNIGGEQISINQEGSVNYLYEYLTSGAYIIKLSGANVDKLEIKVFNNSIEQSIKLGDNTYEDDILIKTFNLPVIGIVYKSFQVVLLNATDNVIVVDSMQLIKQ